MPARENIKILWAEDSAQDQILIRSALDELERAPSLEFANDGVLLLERLDTATPALVVLDLKMPRIGGLEALRRMREHSHWRSLPVAIFSAGQDPTEISACRALGALKVVQKPVNFQEFTSAVHEVVALAARSHRDQRQQTRAVVQQVPDAQ